MGQIKQSLLIQQHPHQGILVISCNYDSEHCKFLECIDTLDICTCVTAFTSVLYFKLIVSCHEPILTLFDIVSNIESIKQI